MLSIDASAIVIFAIVWVLVLVLGKIFFKPITRILDARAGSPTAQGASRNRSRSGAATPRSSPKRS